MRRKLVRYQDNAEHPRLFEEGKPLFTELKGQWAARVFGNEQPITLELACGRGEYTVGLAAEHPDRNFIGVDIKGDRLWKGLDQSDTLGLSNTAFLRTYITLLDRFFAEGEVQEIWLTFPDPRPKRRDEKRRLTAPRFLDNYKNLMKGRGTVHLKTDNNGLFGYTLQQLVLRKDVELLDHTWDLDKSHLLKEHHGIKTRFEAMFKAKGLRIKYLKFRWV